MYCVYTCFLKKASSQNQTLTRTLDLRKNRLTKKHTQSKNRTSRSKIITIYPCHMKDNVKVINFKIKSKGVQDFGFIQITFEKHTTNFHFENNGVGIKMTIVNL